MLYQFKIRLEKLAQRGEPPHATFRKIQNSKLRKPYVARVFEFGSVAEFWRIGISCVVNVVHNAGIARKVARLKPVAVIQG
ncbi:hypothetical protein FDUTEX481_01429 [Tolypothrix sp. PCC 7601]|nr:hypothetical protein FDUTEX481_01429 [Tolypothrix sp. PCC 7601]BAY91632.1 hypothetical protein NIES3275_36560 [Microchaete diplosiphon NIES-3275]